MIKTLNYLFVTCFGIGSFRFAPGTITSLITTIFLYSLFHIINLSNNAILIIILVIFIYSFYAVSEHIKYNENKDPKEVVIDEFMVNLFQFICMNSRMEQQKTCRKQFYFIYIFLYYLDILILKNLFQSVFFDKKFKNSFGVIMDDVIAGLYVVLTLIIFTVIKSKFF